MTFSKINLLELFTQLQAFQQNFLSRYHNLIGYVVSRIFKDHRKFYIGVFWNNAQKKVLICDKGEKSSRR